MTTPQSTQPLFYLAADGGGTKTTVLCARADGTVVAEGTSGPTSLAATSVGAASFNLREAVRQATQTLPAGAVIQTMAMGLAGMDSRAEQEQSFDVFSKVLADFPVHQFLLVNDIVIALASGTNQPNALALIAGTGSNCYGRNDQGQEAKTGGMDYLLTDQGSGYEIGRYVLRSAVKSYDGRIQKTLLEEMVCEHFKIKSIEHLKGVVYNPNLSKTEVAALSKVCAAAHSQGDAIAQEIYDHVVDELQLMAVTVAQRLQMQDKPVAAVLAGGIFKVAYIKEQLVTKLQADIPQIQIVFPEKEPVFGALTLAMNA